MKDLLKIYNFKDKEKVIRDYILQMENRCLTIFEWRNLPDGVTSRWVETILQRTGSLVWTYVNQDNIQQYNDSRDLKEGVYAFRASCGGVEDFSGNPVFSTIAHPRLKKSMTVKLDDEAVLMRNDSNAQGLYNLHLRYATQLCENDLSLLLADISSRAMTVATVGTDTEKQAFENYIQKLTDGNISALIGNLVMDSIKMQDYAVSAHQMITDLVEYEQYLRANWKIELGQNENFNMKREAIMGDEATMNNDSLMTLLEDMLRCRKDAVEKINSLFNLNIEVDYSRTFKNNIVSVDEEAIEDEDGGSDTVEVEGNSNPDEVVVESDNSNVDGNSTVEAEEQMTEEVQEEYVTENNETEQENADVVINVNIDSAEEVVTEDNTEEQYEEENVNESNEEEEEKDDEVNAEDRE